jgi:predicted nicotinamide N-methyase
MRPSAMFRDGRNRWKWQAGLESSARGTGNSLAALLRCPFFGQEFGMNTPAGLRLAQRIGRRFRVSTGPVRLERLELPFTRIAEPDRVLDEVVAEEERRTKSGGGKGIDPPRMPYWAELWESALAIGQVLSRTGGVAFRTGSVLDLGCGMGLAGAAAAAMGHRVMLADLETGALLLARLNTLPWRDRTRVRRVNWQRDRLGERFDLILGADILYERQQWEFLDAFWQAHLAQSGQVLLGEPGRQTGDGFPAWAKERGWSVSQSAETVGPAAKTVRIFRLGRK